LEDIRIYVPPTANPQLDDEAKWANPTIGISVPVPGTKPARIDVRFHDI
jgi:hypothetical protein